MQFSEREKLDRLIYRFGDELREMSHESYRFLVEAAVGLNPASRTAIEQSRKDPERRFTNVVNFKVLRYLERESQAPAIPNRQRSAATVKATVPDDVDTSGLDARLF